jgi:hypothetical protein
MSTRKSPEQIKEEILDSLKDGPLSIEQIRLKAESNWSTTSTYLEELSKDGKVREIISADKAKIYQRVFGDTYFDIPITETERKKFRALFCLILRKYKELGRTPNKTELSKAAVKVINSPESGLSELPTAWYLYGAVPIMIANPSESYQEEVLLEHKQKINSIIEVFAKETENKKARQIQKDQHAEYNDPIYKLHDSFLELMESNPLDKEKIFSVLDDFFVAFPVDNEFPEVFWLANRFISTVRELSYFDKLDNHKTKILLTFDSLWKYVAVYKFYKTISSKKGFSDKTFLNRYLGSAMSVRRACAEEEISDLYSIYWSKIDDREIPDTPETNRMKSIMAGWTGED